MDRFTRTFWAVYHYLKRVVTAFDVLCNVICGGYQDETISSRWQRNNQLGGALIPHIGSIVLTALEKHHGSDALRNDRQRAEAVVRIELAAEGGRKTRPL